MHGRACTHFSLAVAGSWWRGEADDGWCGAGWLGSRLINLQTDSGIRERERLRERETESEEGREHEGNKDRDRSSDSHKEALSVFLSALRTHEKTHCRRLPENMWHAESLRLVFGSAEPAQVSVYGRWRNSGTGSSLKGGCTLSCRAQGVVQEDSTISLVLLLLMPWFVCCFGGCWVSWKSVTK